MRPIAAATLALALAAVTAAAAETSPRPRARETVLLDRAPTLRPLPRPLPAAAAPVDPVEAGMPAPPPPAPVDLTGAAAPPVPASRDRHEAPALTVTLSAANAPRLPAAGAAAAVFVQAAPMALAPRARPAAGAAALPALAVVPMPRPRARPDPAPPAAAAALAVPRPPARPPGLALPGGAEVIPAAAVRIRPGEALVRPRKGSLCGDPAIRGETLAPIAARVAGCGIAAPVRVTEVSGVRLSVPATLDCDAARALRTWIDRGLRPAAGARGLREIRVAASYACRPRNSVRGARVSEHGRGNAIDISAVVLGDGTVLDVLADYRGARGQILRAAHKAACGTFGTTLGPGSDGHHENHLHFDVAGHRSGPYCR